MTSLQLPAPKRSGLATTTRVGENTPAISNALVVTSHEDDGEESDTNVGEEQNVPLVAQPKPQRAPSYEARCNAAAELSKMTPEQRRKNPRKLFVPRSLQDFDDGGAFPEIHVAQYPRHMGNPHVKKKQTNSGGFQTTSRAIVNVEIDEKGEVSYDAIVKGGSNANRTVFSRLEDMKAREAKAEDVALPSTEEESEVANKTQMAIEKILAEKNATKNPSGSAIVNAETSKNQEAKTQFIKYTPRPDAPGYNPAAAQRVIQMVPAQVDPMMPPKHKFIKAPRGPAEDPVPILHAPPKKLTKEERDKWNVPACISNWKNTRGYTIPLDKRLAADGRGLREHTINSNFATLSESLYVAERQARQEVRMRAQVQKKLAMQEKERREEELRNLANQARLERSGVATETAAPSSPANEDTDDEHGSHHSTPDDKQRYGHGGGDDDGDDDYAEDSAPRAARRVEESEDDVAARQRERLRQERRRERVKELRQENNVEIKKRKLESERDVSEKIALGVHTGSGGGAGEVDARLYNQTAGMDSGFGADDEYNTYSKPLFNRTGVTSSSIYRPTRGETAYNADESYDKLVQGATSKFQPAKGFAGAEGGADIRAGPRSAPVQFEKSQK